jgi:hypothetical protein
MACASNEAELHKKMKDGTRKEHSMQARCRYIFSVYWTFDIRLTFVYRFPKKTFAYRDAIGKNIKTVKQKIVMRTDT